MTEFRKIKELTKVITGYNNKTTIEHKLVIQSYKALKVESLQAIINSAIDDGVPSDAEVSVNDKIFAEAFSVDTISSNTNITFTWTEK